jgi:hypothetical protein
MLKMILVGTIGVIVGAICGWQARSFVQEGIRPSASFVFRDNLADARAPFLSAEGTWRGGDIANKANTVKIWCCAEKTCEMHQADIVSFGEGTYLSLYDNSFTVTQLDAERLTAETTLPDLCIRQTLLIDRKAKAVSLVRMKINNEDLCEVVQSEPVTISLVDPRAEPGHKLSHFDETKK